MRGIDLAVRLLKDGVINVRAFMLFGYINDFGYLSDVSPMTIAGDNAASLDRGTGWRWYEIVAGIRQLLKYELVTRDQVTAVFTDAHPLLRHFQVNKNHHKAMAPKDVANIMRYPSIETAVARAIFLDDYEETL